jgi:hypothetical protein
MPRSVTKTLSKWCENKHGASKIIDTFETYQGLHKPLLVAITTYVSFIDAYSRFTWLYLLKHKYDIFDVFTQFQTHVERLLGHKILHVQSDWGANIAISTPSFISLVLYIV